MLSGLRYYGLAYLSLGGDLTHYDKYLIDYQEFDVTHETDYSVPMTDHYLSSHFSHLTFHVVMSYFCNAFAQHRANVALPVRQ